MSLPVDDPMIACGMAILRRLQQRAPGGALPRLEEDRVFFAEDGSGYEYRVVSRPFSWRLVDGTRLESLLGDPDFMEQLEALWDAGRIRSPMAVDLSGGRIPRFDSPGVQKNLLDFLCARVCAYLDEGGTLDVSPLALGEFLYEQTTEWGASNVKRQVTVPLL